MAKCNICNKQGTFFSNDEKWIYIPNEGCFCLKCFEERMKYGT